MTYKALILNDYPETPYATWVMEGEKTIETRMGRLFSYRGDIIICCGKTNSVGDNAGKALCLVEIWKGRDMLKSDELAAKIEYHPKRKCLLLRNWRHFSRTFEFNKLKVSGTWQGIFEMTIPDGIEIIPRPDIKPFEEIQIIENSLFV